MTQQHERHNRDFWNADADDYQEAHGQQLARGKVWGAFARPEADVDVLGEVAGCDVLEYGCGGAQWSIALARDGARVVALDQSIAQLGHAARNIAASRAIVRLVCASGEAVPMPDASFDLMFCDHGAMSFCDPERSVPEVARLLRPGGRLVFNKASILMYLTWDPKKKQQGTRLVAPYFGERAFDFGEGTIDFQLPYGEWFGVFRKHGLVVDDLVELRPSVNASTTYHDFVPLEWARDWPAEEIWSVRKP